MKISKSAATTARRIFRLCLTDGRLDEAKLEAAVRRLAAARPRDHRGILHALKRLVRLELSRRQVVIESATELPEPLKLRIAANLGARYGSGLVFEHRTDPELIGGLRLRVGSDVWDGTVRGRIDRFARAF